MTKVQALLYNVGMSNYAQYTIRKIPKEVDARLKAQAKKRGLSLNKLVLDKLGAIPIKDTKPKVHHDLDWFFGSMPAEEADELWCVIKGAREADKQLAEAELKVGYE